MHSRSCFRWALAFALMGCVAAVAEEAPPSGDTVVAQELAGCSTADPVSALEACTTVIEAGTSSDEAVEIARAYRAFAYLRSARYEEAAADYTEWLKAHPTDVEALNARGVARRGIGLVDEAIADYTAALEIDPNHFRAYFNRALAYTEKEDYDLGIEDYSAALELQPEDAPTFYNRGNAYFDSGDYESAVADYTSAIEINPNHAESYLNRGFAHAKLGNTAAAKEDLRKAISMRRRSQA